MPDKTSSVLVAARTPWLSKSVCTTAPATTRLKECVAALCSLEPETSDEKRVVQQLRREVHGARFDILVVAEEGSARRADPDAPLSDVAVERTILKQGKPEKHWVAELELQSYAPVGLCR